MAAPTIEYRRRAQGDPRRCQPGRTVQFQRQPVTTLALQRQAQRPPVGADALEFDPVGLPTDQAPAAGPARPVQLQRHAPGGQVLRVQRVVQRPAGAETDPPIGHPAVGGIECETPVGVVQAQRRGRAGRRGQRQQQPAEQARARARGHGSP